MRKQTKVVAVASAATLLAIGASMTSFAATGWVEEDGIWYFYDNDGNRVEDEWKKSGDNWYWLDSEENGAMAVDKLIDDDGDIYYVDSNGVMVKNTWVKVVNEDQDEDDDPAEYNYYYMQSNGKAYKAPDSSNTRFRTIDGKRYAFDDDGKMLYGWIDGQGERQNGEDDWEQAVYYLGSWEDGAMKTGWQKIYVHDNEEDDDMEHWFHFKANGKKRSAASGDAVKEEKINGKRYGFDDRGVMVYEWTMTTEGTSTATKASASNWKYFRNPEDGARVTKGWFRVVAPLEDNDNVFRSNYGDNPSDTFAWKDADEENEKWYYTNGDGNLEVGKIKKIKGKYYGFYPEGDTRNNNKTGSMLSGLVLMNVDPSTGEIYDVIDDDVDSDELDDLLDDDTSAKIVQDYAGCTAPGITSLYYFGSDEVNDGAMRTGSTNISIDGESYSFLFSKTGGAEGKGRGLTGIDDRKYIYKLGCRIKASKDDKYQVVEVLSGTATGLSGSNAVDVYADGVTVIKWSLGALKDMSDTSLQPTNTQVSVSNMGTPYKNDDKETVSYVDLSGQKLYLVNTSGAVQRSKVAAKDGDDWFFYVKDRDVKLYTNNRNLISDTAGAVSGWESLVRNLSASN